LLTRIFIFCIFFGALYSCASFSPLLKKKSWDNTLLTVETLSLFNQKIPTMENYKSSWEGDWLLRRKRLSLLDKLLANNLPNIIFFQEMLNKNAIDSDAAILESSSLAYYKSFPVSIKEDPKTDEEEFSSIYVRLEDLPPDAIKATKKVWKLEDSSYLIFQKLIVNRKPLYLFNVNIPYENKDPEKFFVFLRNKIEESIMAQEDCLNHIIVAGYFGSEKLRDLNLMMRFLGLIDTASGFCSERQMCDTQNPSNPIFNSSSLENKFSRTDRIFVHKSTRIEKAGITYSEHTPSLASFKAKYQLHSIAPSLRYGWQTKIKFARCSKKL
jgi:hypothetical protein